ncbi:MAG TPA: glycine--tRNA ligase subunit beta [Alphaproteobacteria bacterium]|nr:glycine--tRNA ligase subunit beta [Alphaproteobacteria bacterium]
MPELLIELFSEEIPARMQARAAEDFKRLMTEKLRAASLTFTEMRAYVTPRRLTLVVEGLPERQPDVTEERRGPRVGAPAQAIEGFVKASGMATIEEAEQRDAGKGMYYFYVSARQGRPAGEVVSDALAEILRQFPWPKSMRWPGADFEWVRPLHTVLALLDGRPMAVAGFEPSHRTHGHRFLAPGPIHVEGFADYQEKLARAYVLLDPIDRKEHIVDQAELLVRDAGLALKPDPALIEEVAGLVEWPVVLMGHIEERFMALPPEVLTTAMRTQQRYFALHDGAGRLAPRFLLVANIEPKDGGAAIVAGNERVLRARLADAEFFWNQDRKTPLEDRLPALDEIVFHAKLGSVAEKVARVAALAPEIALKIPEADPKLVARAARLAKADLVTGMVGEFPELQGVMGRYYALASGEPQTVAEAIAEHYAPQGPNDRCPTAPISVAVALADKIDTLVGFFAIGERPTGSKDPFALRRAALGSIRLIVENGLRLNLTECVRSAGRLLAGTQAGPERPGVASGELLEFLADRLKVHLRERGVRHDLIAAVFALGGEDDLVRLLARVEALQRLLGSEDGVNLLVAFRRAANILKIEEQRDSLRYQPQPEPSLLRLPEEKALYASLVETQETIDMALAAERYEEVMRLLARLRPTVDAFFDKVTVNAPEPELRANRLRLLAAIPATLGRVADFSRIEG